jgi:transposase
VGSRDYVGLRGNVSLRLPRSGLVQFRLRKDFRNRKNSLFYKTENGAEVGDLFMSLIHTCELNGANPFDYLTELQKHAEELAKHPAAWMPWNYRDALAQSGTGEDPDSRSSS